jgi:hypothetical protein
MPNNIPVPEFISIKTASRKYECSKQTIAAVLRRYPHIGIKLGRSVRINAEALHEVLTATTWTPEKQRNHLKKTPSNGPSRRVQ